MDSLPRLYAQAPGGIARQNPGGPVQSSAVGPQLGAAAASNLSANNVQVDRGLPMNPATAALPPLINKDEKVNGITSVLPPGPFEFPAPTATAVDAANAGRIAPVAPTGSEVIVKEVRIEGNHQTSSGKLPKLRTRVGEAFDPHIVQEDVRALAQSHNFLDVRSQYQAVPGGMAVIFQVVERPIMEHVDFVGNQDTRTQTLRKKSELEKNQPLDPYAVEEGRRKVEEYYHEEGYSHAAITILEGTKAGDRGVTYMVDEGPQEKILWTSAEGNKVAGDARLRAIGLQEKPGIAWLFGGKFDRKKVDEDQEKLYAYYRALGFFKAKISPDISWNEDHTYSQIKWIIDEGPRFKIRTVSFNGNQKFKVGELNAKLEENPGKDFNQSTLDHDLNGIRDVYGSRGFVFADVQARTVLLEDQPQMDLVYEITEGKQYRVGQININIGGDSPHTSHRVILDRLSLRPGDILDTKKLRDDERRLKFASVFNTDPTKGGAPKITFSKPDGLKDEQVADRGSGDSSSGSHDRSASRPSSPSSGSRNGNGSGSASDSGASGYGSGGYGSSYRGQSPDSDMGIINATIVSDGSGNDYVVLTPTEPPVLPSNKAVAAGPDGDLKNVRFQSPDTASSGVRLASANSDWDGYGGTSTAGASRSAWGISSGGSSYLPPGAQPQSAGNVTSPYSPNPMGAPPASASPYVGPPSNAAAPGFASGPPVRAAPAVSSAGSATAPTGGTQMPVYSNAVYGANQVPAQNTSFQGGSFPAGGTPPSDGFTSAPPAAASGSPSYSPPGFTPPASTPTTPAPSYVQAPVSLQSSPATQFAQAPLGQPGQPVYQPPPPSGYVYQAPPGAAPVANPPYLPAPGVAPNAPPGTVAGGPPYGQQPAMPGLPPDVSIQPLGSEPPQYLPLDISANETQTGRLMLGVGVNSDAGLVGNFVLDEQNFDIARLPRSWEDISDGTAWRGGGQRFRIEANPGTLVQRYAVTYQQPYLFETAGGWVGYDVSAFYFTRIYEDWSEARVGGKTGLSYAFTPDLRGSIGFDGERVTVYNPHTPTPPLLDDVHGPNDRYGFSVGLQQDTRDSPFLPTQGHLITFNFEQVVGTFDYPHGEVEGRQYFLLHERADGSGRHTLGIGGIFGITANNTPIYDNYFAGGFSTLRGFAFRGASPLQENVQVGGQLEALGTVEYMFPITADDALRGVVFCDFGTVDQTETRNPFPISGNGMRVAPGFGLRINVPAMGPAPIALDLAFPVVSQPGDQIQNFSFFVGVGR